METKQKFIEVWFDKIDALSYRERLTILLATLAISAFIWDSVVLQEQLRSRKETVVKLKAIEADINSGNAKLIQLRTQVAQDPNIIEHQRLQRYKDEIERIDEVLKEKTLEFISPQQMVKVLKSLIRDEDKLRLVSFESMQPKVPFEDEAAEGDSIETANSVNENPGTPMIYLHGMEIKFKGDFFNVLNYVKRLENLDWEFAWNAFTITLEKYPTTDVYLRLETLSMTEGWIGV